MTPESVLMLAILATGAIALNLYFAARLLLTNRRSHRTARELAKRSHGSRVD